MRCNYLVSTCKPGVGRSCNCAATTAQTEWLQLRCKLSSCNCAATAAATAVATDKTRRRTKNKEELKTKH